MYGRLLQISANLRLKKMSRGRHKTVVLHLEFYTISTANFITCYKLPLDQICTIFVLQKFSLLCSTRLISLERKMILHRDIQIFRHIASAESAFLLFFVRRETKENVPLLSLLPDLLDKKRKNF